MPKADRASRRTAIVQPWTGASMLEVARRLNERCFELLASVADSNVARDQFSCVFSSRERWARVDARASERAGRCPVLLLDLNFRQAEWWTNVRRWDIRDAPRTTSSALFAADSAICLSREILIEARGFVRSTPHGVGLVFGMAQGVAAAISDMSIADIDRIAMQHSSLLRPRWEGNRIFWSRLLEATLVSDDDMLTEVHLHSLQLLGAERFSRSDEALAHCTVRYESSTVTISTIPIVHKQPLKVIDLTQIEIPEDPPSS